MRTESIGHCPLCTTPGGTLYDGVGDPLFGVKGRWRLVRCANLECRLVWQDPAIVREDIHRAYAGYYTHGVPEHHQGSPAERLQGALFNFLDRRISVLLKVKEERRRAGGGYLEGMAPGRLLDVGCGNGEFLHKLRGRGWQVEGTEVDAWAVQAAMASFGIKVKQGELQALAYPAESFDAITVRHVIEHLHDPVGLLKECWRILRPGGRLVLVTPNADSLGHRIYGTHWRGLEQPRHLSLHTRDSLAGLARHGGLTDFSVISTAQGMAYVLRDSDRIRCQGQPDLKSWWNVLVGFWWWQWRESKLIRAGKPVGEELVLIAQKSGEAS